ncbi:hypothetical protein GCM10009414_18000 [Tatumella terrea]|uniref:glycosyltransferase family 2 protein n=1 Tax=Tatumella terrea TaxID=419007 RepID=UPI0031DE5371
MHTPLFSIIIPMYNAESSLDKCISSALRQNVSKEVIVINDGSTDNTKELLKKYDGLVEVINNDNHGVSYSRNLGIKTARGEFICFLDSDDFLSDNSLEIYQGFMKSNVCMVVGASQHYTYDLKKITEKKGYKKNDEFLESSLALNRLIYKDRKFGVCDKVFRVEIIKNNDIHFEKGLSNFEDFCFLTEYLKKSFGNEVVFTNEVVYNYVESKFSLTRSTLNMNQLAFMPFLSRMERTLADKNLPYFYYNNMIISMDYMLRVMNCDSTAEDKKALKGCYKSLNGFYKENFFKYLKKPLPGFKKNTQFFIFLLSPRVFNIIKGRGDD